MDATSTLPLCPPRRRHGGALSVMLTAPRLQTRSCDASALSGAVDGRRSHPLDLAPTSPPCCHTAVTKRRFELLLAPNQRRSTAKGHADEGSSEEGRGGARRRALEPAARRASKEGRGRRGAPARGRRRGALAEGEACAGEKSGAGGGAGGMGEK
jgi:hypothetical protein